MIGARALLLISCLPGLLLAGVALLVPQPAVAGGLAFGGAVAVVLALLGGALLHFGAARGVQHALVGVVAGLVVRLFGLTAACLAATAIPGVDVLSAALAAVGALVVALVADAAVLARALAAEPAQPQEATGV